MVLIIMQFVIRVYQYIIVMNHMIKN